MFGVKLKQRRDLIEGLARALIFSGQNKIGHQDQASLDKIVWPAAKYDVVIDFLFFCLFVDILIGGGLTKELSS